MITGLFLVFFLMWQQLNSISFAFKESYFIEHIAKMKQRHITFENRAPSASNLGHLELFFQYIHSLRISLL